MTIDPDRTAKQLVADLKWGRITQLDRGTVERVVHVALREGGRINAAHTERLVIDVARRTFDIWRQRTLARSG